MVQPIAPVADALPPLRAGGASAAADAVTGSVGNPAIASPDPVVSGTGHRRVALVVGASAFMQYLDTTLMTTALPQIAKALGVSITEVSMVPLAYMVTLAMLIPIGGAAAGRFGARNVFLCALVLFAAGSLLSGSANGLGMLLAARMLQGAASAVMLPVGRLIVVSSVEKSQILSAMNWLMIPAVVGPILGPPLGGLLATYISWRWVFLVSLPLALAALAGAALILRAVDVPRQRFDLPGVVLSGMTIAGGVTGLALAASAQLAPAAACLAVMAAGGALYARHARRADDAVLDLRLLRTPTFSISVYAGALLRATTGALMYLFILQLQVGFGKSAAGGGGLIAIATLGSLLARVAGTGLLRRVNIRTCLLASVFITAATGFGLALTSAHTPAMVLQALLLVFGFAQSVPIFVMGGIAYADISRARLNAATTLFTTTQQATSSLGIALAVALLAGAAGLNGVPHAGAAEYGLAMAAAALCSLAAAVPLFRLAGDAGAALVARQ